jgi:hypothetical protein
MPQFRPVRDPSISHAVIQLPPHSGLKHIKILLPQQRRPSMVAAGIIAILETMNMLPEHCLV